MPPRRLYTLAQRPGTVRIIVENRGSGVQMMCGSLDRDRVKHSAASWVAPLSKEDSGWTTL